MYYIVPLGCDYDESRTKIGPSTITRCQKALHEARRLRLGGAQATLVLAPSIEAARKLHGPDSHRTMASMMQDWFREQGEVVELVNVDDTNVSFDTTGEVVWSVETIGQYHRRRNALNPNSLQHNSMNDAVVIFVSNRRHLRRVWWNLKLMCGLPRSVFASPDAFAGDGLPVYTTPEVWFTASEEAPPTLWHECLAYVKLFLVWRGWYTSTK